MVAAYPQLLLNSTNNKERRVGTPKRASVRETSSEGEHFKLELEEGWNAERKGKKNTLNTHK